MSEAEGVARIFELQRDVRLRAKAQQRARQRLKDAHPDEYARFYAEERAALDAENEQ